MKTIRSSRAMWMAAAILGMVSLGSNAFAKSKPGFGQFLGAYAGKISFPTTLFGTPVTYSGDGVLVVYGNDKKASFKFICSATGYQAIGTSVSIFSKLKSNGRFVTTGALTGEPFARAAGKFKLHGKKISCHYTLTAETSQTTLDWGLVFTISGKKITAKGPATFTLPYGIPPETVTGTFTFTGSRVAL